jgi:hypothetical protein
MKFIFDIMEGIFAVIGVLTVFFWGAIRFFGPDPMPKSKKGRA